MGLTKATIENVDTGDTFECLFNPTEYTLAKTNTWQPKPAHGREIPKLEYTGGGNATLTLQLFFDTLEIRDKGKDYQIVSRKGKPQDVRDYIAKLENLMKVVPKTRNKESKQGRPPYCKFHWGGDLKFQAVLTSLNVKYTLFTEEGIPVRATADVTLQQVASDNDKPGTNPTSFVPEPGYKRRIVQPNDTLAWIAFDEYGDAGKWRKIADLNRIEDPLALRPGDILAIPPL